MKKDTQLCQMFIVLEVVIQRLPLVHSDQRFWIVECELLPLQATHVLGKLVLSPMCRCVPAQLLRNVPHHQHRRMFRQQGGEFEAQVKAGAELVFSAQVAGLVFHAGQQPAPLVVDLPQRHLLHVRASFFKRKALHFPEVEELRGVVAIVSSVNDLRMVMVMTIQVEGMLPRCLGGLASDARLQ